MEGRLVLVATFGSVPEGFLAKARLEAEDIPVLSKGGDGPYRMGPVHLFVHEAFEVQARLILEVPGGTPDGPLGGRMQPGGD